MGKARVGDNETGTDDETRSGEQIDWWWIINLPWWLASGCQGTKWDVDAPLPSAERPHNVWVMGDALAEDGGSQRIMAGYGRLACNGNGCLVIMEHEGGIEWVVGLGWDLGVDMDLGLGLGMGSNSTSPLRPSPMRLLIHNGQVFKLCSLVPRVFLFFPYPPCGHALLWIYLIFKCVWLPKICFIPSRCLYVVIDYIIDARELMNRGNLGACWQSCRELGCQRVEWHNVKGQC